MDQDDRALVVASDGLWEYVSNKILISKLVPFILSNNPKNACRKLINFSSDKWDEVKVFHAGTNRKR
jgi:serine/threonine protein phosphatase PrpC